MAFSSSRGGHHELYRVSLAKEKLHLLTHAQTVNYFPRFSLGGARLLFARS